VYVIVWSGSVHSITRDELLCVVCAGRDDVVELLVNSGHDVNTQRPDGITALMIACRMVCFHVM